jgi:16S rRNA (guanine527-N7)-methyltransferase
VGRIRKSLPNLQPLPAVYKHRKRNLDDQNQLEKAIAEAGYTDIGPETIRELDRYCQVLWDWNTKINLTRHTTYQLFVERDLLDSLELSKVIASGESVLDVGTGGGVPGILLAILRPDIRVALCDSVAKKAKVTESIVQSLGMTVPVFANRAQDLLRDFRYDSLVARAVGPLPKLCSWFREYWGDFGRLLAIKGPRWIEERGEARHRGLMKGVELRRLSSYLIPATGAQSFILQLRQASQDSKTLDEE